MLSRCGFVFLSIVVLCIAASAVSAQVVAPEDTAWQNSWTGYFWVPGYSGDATIGGHPVDVDLSVSDTADNIKDFFEAGFSGHYEGNKYPWGLIADVNYWRMEGDVNTTSGPVRLTPRQFMIELAGARTVSQKDMGGYPVQRVQVLLGARYNMFKASLEGSGISVSGSHNLIDPMVGGRIYQALSKLWGVNLRVDFGGFGVGSDLAINVVGTVGYNISQRNSILAGWKYYNLDYEPDDQFKWDVAQSGPFVAFQTRF